MSQSIRMPKNLKGCHQLIAEQSEQIGQLDAELEKLRKLVSQMINGNRSEKRIFHDADQELLPFESDKEFQAAQAEAEAEAETVIQEYQVKREIRKKKPRNESLPEHLPRVEETAEVPESMRICPEHGERTIIGYDFTETLMREPPRPAAQIS